MSTLKHANRLWLSVVVASLAVAYGCSGSKPNPAADGPSAGTGSPQGSQGSAAPTQGVQDKDDDPPEVGIGERLFRETRFNQFFYARSKSQQDGVNTQLSAGDPVLELLPTLAQSFRSPYAGQGINCASCHFVGELKDAAGLGNRAYNDFARRSPIPERTDRPEFAAFGGGRTTTLRNSPAFVNSTLSLEDGYQSQPLFLHWDGEFASVEDLVAGGFTGRNFGWYPDEGALALSNLARVLREDNGQGKLAQDYGGSYKTVLLGQDSALPAKFRLPPEYRIDVVTATDDQLMAAVSRLVGAYLRSLIYQRDAVTGEFNGSPYDAFLAKNKLPRAPSGDESDLAYARKLAGLIDAIPDAQLQWVTDGADGKFQLSRQSFAFGKKELQGLKIFLKEQRPIPLAPSQSGVGNCVACHAPPAFTDFAFHNTGASQDEYDSVHGRGAFAQIAIPSFAERTARAHEFLEPSAADPFAKAQFASIPSKDRPGFADLGVWNVYGNAAIAGSQPGLRQALCRKLASERGTGASCTDDAALSMGIASFKTPTVRNLGQSAPYLHTGQKDGLEDVLGFYIEFSALARQGKVRASDPEIAQMGMSSQDIAPVAAFLRSLNEDYH